jgi:hypothetical protein
LADAQMGGGKANGKLKKLRMLVFGVTFWRVLTPILFNNVINKFEN